MEIEVSDGKSTYVERRHYSIIARVKEFSNVSIHKPVSETSEEYFDYEIKSHPFAKYLVFPVTVYPNGHNTLTEGSVSLVLHANHYETKRHTRYADFEMTFTAEVVDAEGGGRFPQSFVYFRDFSKHVSLNEEEKHGKSAIQKYMSRNSLLEAPSELLPNDTLTLRIDVVVKRIIRLRKPIAISNGEFIVQGEEGEKRFLHVHSPTVRILRNKSKYMKHKLDAWMQGENSNYIRIPDHEVEAFDSIKGWLNGDTNSYGVVLYDALDMYAVAQKYRIMNVVDSYRNLLARFICQEIVEEVSVLAQTFDDYTLRLIAENFRRQKSSAGTNSNCPVVTGGDFVKTTPDFKSELGPNGTRHYLHLDSFLAKCLFRRSGQVLFGGTDIPMQENNSRYMRIPDEEYPIFLRLENLYTKYHFQELLYRACEVYASAQRYDIATAVDSYRNLLKHFTCRKVLSEILNLEAMFDEDTLRQQAEKILKTENKRCGTPKNESESQENGLNSEVRTGGYFYDRCLGLQIPPWSESTTKDETKIRLRYWNMLSSYSQFLQANFKLQDSPHGTKYYLYLDSPMARLLSEQSEYFERIPNIPMVESISGYTRIPDEEFTSFLKMGIWLKSGESFCDALFSDDFDMYELAQKYQMKGLIENSRRFFSTHICHEIVPELWKLAETYEDDFLRNMLEGFQRRQEEIRAVSEEDDSNSQAGGTDDAMEADENFEGRRNSDDEENLEITCEAMQNEKERDSYNFYF